MTTTIDELCEVYETLEEELQAELDVLLSSMHEPLSLQQPGTQYEETRDFAALCHQGRWISMSWRHDGDDLPQFPRSCRPLTPVRLIMLNVGKQFAGLPVTLFNGTAHATQVNDQGIACFRGAEALKIFSDTSNLRASAW